MQLFSGALLGTIGAALVAGCAAGDWGAVEDGEELGTLSVRTGPHCAAGCDLERPFLVGTEERLALIGAELGLEVRSRDPGVMAAWVEHTALCCTRATCREHRPAERCGGTLQREPMIVARAIAPGATDLEIVDADGRIVRSHAVRVEEAAQLVATAAVALAGDLQDVAGGSTAKATELPPLEPTALDGRLQSLDLRVGTVTLLRLEAQSSAGEAMHASRGLGARIDDPEIAVVTPGSALLPGLGQQVVQGPMVAVVPRSAGQTVLALATASAKETLTVHSLATCEPREPDVVWSDAPCETDADCVPSGCCHATSCVAASEAPDCSDVACTLECEEGTLDCGGRCLCLQGRCAAHRLDLSELACPDPPPSEPMDPPSPF